MRSARSLCAMALLLALRALPAHGDPGLLSGSLLDKVVQLNPVITGNTLSASITLAGGITADLTITFHRPKTGLQTRRGAALAGRVLVAPIGIPQEADRG